MERLNQRKDQDFQRKRRLDLFGEALGAVARSQSKLTPQETELLTTRLVGVYVLCEITEMVNKTLTPKAISKILGQKAK